MGEEELNRRIGEAAEDQRMRTVLVSGLAEGTVEDTFQRFCKKFGAVERLKVSKDSDGKTFGLVEFKDRAPAHMCKVQRKFLVDGKVLVCSESKTMVDESVFVEQTVQFQAPILDGMNMRQVISQQPELQSKLAKVRAAALELAQERDPIAKQLAARVEEKKKKKEGKEKKEKKAKKKEAKEKKEKNEKKQKQKAAKPKRKAKAKAKRKKIAAVKEDESDAASISESSGGPVDIDGGSDIDIIDNENEFVVLQESSASSISSEDTDDEGELEAQALPVQLEPEPIVEPFKLVDILGKWAVDKNPETGIWAIEDSGRTRFDGKLLKPPWSMVEETDDGEVVSIYCQAQRDEGWELILRLSNPEKLRWKKTGVRDCIWERQFEYGPAM